MDSQPAVNPHKAGTSAHGVTPLTSVKYSPLTDTAYVAVSRLGLIIAVPGARSARGAVRKARKIWLENCAKHYDEQMKEVAQ